jgi:radical SAM protein with 4Fe4S-binding SPASM domain
MTLKEKRQLYEVDLHITNRCRNSCPHCNVSSPEPMPEMSTEELFLFLEQAAELGAHELHITGGEPFLRKDIYTVIKKATDLGMRVETMTSIPLSLSDMQHLHEVKLDYLAISLDGVQEYQDFLRCEGNYQDSIENIKKALQCGLKVRVNTFLWKDNVEQIYELFNVTRELGVTKHVVFYFTPIGRGELHLDKWMNLSEWKHICDEMRTYIQTNIIPHPDNKTKYIIQRGYYNDEKELAQKEGACRLIERQNLVLLCDGTIYPCVMFMKINKELGNVNKRSLNEIWNDEDSWNSYRYDLDGNETCLQCDQVKHCMGGCPGYSYLFKKDVNAGDYRCNNMEEPFPACVWYTEHVR